MTSTPPDNPDAGLSDTDAADRLEQAEAATDQVPDEEVDQPDEDVSPEAGATEPPD
jgi:hypothetical protein